MTFLITVYWAQQKAIELETAPNVEGAIQKAKAKLRRRGFFRLRGSKESVKVIAV